MAYNTKSLVHALLKHLPVLLVFLGISEPPLIVPGITRVEVTADFFIGLTDVLHIDAHIAVDNFLLINRIWITLISA